MKVIKANASYKTAPLESGCDFVLALPMQPSWFEEYAGQGFLGLV